MEPWQVNDLETRLCRDIVHGTYWVYSGTMGHKFPEARTPGMAWKYWYDAMLRMTEDPDVRAAFLKASQEVENAEDPTVEKTLEALAAASCGEDGCEPDDVAELGTRHEQAKP